MERNIQETMYRGKSKEMEHMSGKSECENRANGTRYEGEWLNNKQHGEGKLVYQDGDVKQCKWKEGRQDLQA